MVASVRLNAIAYEAWRAPGDIDAVIVTPSCVSQLSPAAQRRQASARVDLLSTAELLCG
jgi:hypothetical protein